MEVNKRRKAIIQAQASLRIDRIYLRPNYLVSYIKQSTQPVSNGPILILKRGGKSGTRS